MPALAIAAALRRSHPDWRVLLVGAMRGIEAQLLPTRDFPYQLLPAEPIYRKQWWKNLRWPLLALRLRREVDRLLERERPAVVIGTGGYASGPVVWRASRRGIPTAMLELNAYPGLAVRWLARSVREVWLGSPEARQHLRRGAGTEIVDTGAPILPRIPVSGRRRCSASDSTVPAPSSWSPGGARARWPSTRPPRSGSSPVVPMGCRSSGQPAPGRSPDSRRCIDRRPFRSTVSWIPSAPPTRWQISRWLVRG